MTKVASEDSVRRGLSAMPEEESSPWLQKHLQFTYRALLEEPWALDVDTTVKPLYGHQEEAKVGYSAKARAAFARLSQLFHRELTDGSGRGGPGGESDSGIVCAAGVVEVAGRTAAVESSEVPASRLQLGNGAGDGRSRAAGIPYVFKLKQSVHVKRLIAKLMGNGQWVDAGPKWQGLDTELQLSGWSQKRRVVRLRRPLREGVAEEKKSKSKRKAAQQLNLDLPEATYQGVLYEYAVLVTSLGDEVRTIGQHYRDRGDSENNFDELKNQWAWAVLPRTTGTAVR